MYVDLYFILPLQTLHADPDHGEPEAVDAVVQHPHYIDVDTTLEIDARTGVGLAPIGGEMTRKTLQCGLCLHAKKDIHRSDKSR